MDYTTQSKNELIEIINALNKKISFADAITQLSSELHVVINKDDLITYVSPSYVQITGFTKEQIVGKRPVDFVHKDDYQEIVSALKEASNNPGYVIKVSKFRCLLNESTYFHLEGSFKMLPKSSDSESILCDLKVIEEQENAIRALNEHERKLQVLFDTLPHGIFECTKEGDIVICNEAYREILELSKDEVKSIKFWDLIEDPNEKERLPCYLRHVVESESPLNAYHTVFVNKSGTRKHIRVDWSLVQNEKGETTFFSGIITDTTRQVKAEQKLENSLEHLKHRNEELKHFGFLAAHNLRSPLVNIGGFAGELKLDCKTVLEAISHVDFNEQTKEKVVKILERDIPDSIRFISNGVIDMNRITKSIHKLTETTYSTLKPTVVDMNSIVQTIKTDFALRPENDDIIFSTHDLPECYVDPTMIKSIVMNLFDNAIKFRDSARQCNIKVSAKKLGKVVTYCIEDNGVGIEKEFYSKVFQTFQQLDPTSTSGEGLGLTLTIRMLERNNGAIWIESVPGEGTKFFFTLPTESF
jgi:PAS domain S-box-containing protein